MIKKNKTYSVIIIGCGNIAGGYDETLKKFPLTHAGGFKKSSNFKLVACVDKNIKKANIFKKKWGFVESFSSVEQVIKEKKQFDVVSICSPTDNHLYQLKMSIKLKPKIVFCEKPLTYKYDTSKKIVKLFKDSQISLAVNYSRRWAPDIISLRKDLSNRNWGKILGVSAQYTKGLFNNGSHMLDLLIYLFGDLKVKWVGSKISDFWKNDPTMSFVLCNKEKFDIAVNGIKFNHYNLFEIEIFTEKGIIIMEDSGNKWIFKKNYNLKNSKYFNNYYENGKIDQSMLMAVMNIRDHLNSNTELASNGVSSLKSIKICEKILSFKNL